MRRIPLLAWTAIALAASPQWAAGATIEGTVAIAHTAAAPATKPRYPVAATYVIRPPDPPAAIVYIEGEFPKAPREPARAEMGQHGYQFAPGLLAVQTGTLVAFPNLDHEYHSVFSYSKPKRFDLGRYHKDDAPATLPFDQPGVIKLYCEIHDHMRGTILVLDTPHFQKTDGNGRYRLEGLPAGRHVVKAWLEDGTTLERAVELGDGTTLHVDFPGP